MQRFATLASLGLLVAAFATAPAARSQDGRYLIDENGNLVNATQTAGPSPQNWPPDRGNRDHAWVGEDGRSVAQAQVQATPLGPDPMVTMTNPATGQTYQVRVHNPAAVRAWQGNQPPADAPTAAAPAGRIRLMSWRDPNEGAFTVSLPAGWQIQGGTVRTTQVEPHYVIRAQSPSGGVQMFMDDPNIAVHQIPGWGTREGQIIPSAWGGRILVERYLPAPILAEQYVRQRYCPAASAFQGGIIPGQTRDLNQKFGPIAAAEGKRVHLDAGEISFKCGQQNGYVYAITLQAWQQGGPLSLWVVYRIAGYLAQPQDTTQAAAAMHAMLGSFQMDQGWLQRLAQQSGDLAGNVIHESNAVTQSTISRAQEMDAQEQDNFEAWKQRSDQNFNAIEHANKAITGAGNYGGSGSGHDYNAQLGTKTVCDDLGRCQTVDAGVDKYYSDCSGTMYAGTASGDPPPSSLSACWNPTH